MSLSFIFYSLDKWWLTIFWTFLCPFFLSAMSSLLLALQHGRDLKCHTEWLPPHVWKLRWRETGAGLSSLFSLLFACRFGRSWNLENWQYVKINAETGKNSPEMLESVLFPCLRTLISLQRLSSSTARDSQDLVSWGPTIITLNSYPILKVCFGIMHASNTLYVCKNLTSNRRICVRLVKYTTLQH